MIDIIITVSIFIVLFGIAYLLYIYDNSVEEKRNDFFKKYAETNKYSFKQEENTVLMNYDFELFKNEPWQTAQRIVEGHIDTTKFILFDCIYEIGLGRNKKSNKQTAIIFTVNFDLSNIEKKIKTKDFTKTFVKNIKKTNIEISGNSLLMYIKNTTLKTNENTVDNFISDCISIVKQIREGKI